VVFVEPYPNWSTRAEVSIAGASPNQPAEQGAQTRNLADRIDRMYTQDVNGKTEVTDRDEGCRPDSPAALTVQPVTADVAYELVRS
jgi:hypothetical protein